MKYSTALIVAFIAFTSAQSDLSECGQSCVSNMQQKFAEFGCSSGDDVACLCADPEFANGLKDCSAEACGAQESAKVVAFGAQYCEGGVSSVIASASSVLKSVTSAASSVASSIAASATGDDDSESASATTTVTSSTGITTETSTATATTSEGVVGGPVPISTRYSLSAIVDASGSSTVSQQTVGTETIYSSDASATPVSTISNESLTSTLFGAGGAGGSGNGTQTTLATAVSTSEILSTITNESTTQVSTVGSSTISSEVTTDAAAATSTSSEGAGARQTAGAAFMAVAGLAALIV